jgi:hypothetical protein
MEFTIISDVYNNPNFVFVSFEPGSRGHTIGRILCSLPEVYWYSNSDNGINPWNISHKCDWIIQRRVAPKHFDRTMPNGEVLPPVWDYVKDFVDCDTYYRDLFPAQFEKAQGQQYLNTHRLLYCTHSLPEEILTQFPNSRVINIVADADDIVNRYMHTTAHFPAYLKLEWMNGSETEYGKMLYQLSKRWGLFFTVQDVWEHLNSGSFYQHIETQIKNNMALRNQTNNSRVLNVSYREYRKMKEFIV